MEEVRPADAQWHRTVIASIHDTVRERLAAWVEGGLIDRSGANDLLGEIGAPPLEGKYTAQVNITLDIEFTSDESEADLKRLLESGVTVESSYFPGGTEDFQIVDQVVIWATVEAADA